MEGCSPQRIDSVIQAHLPYRRLNLSTRPDTLEIPGLKGRSPYPAVSDLPSPYDGGYFHGNPMLHRELLITPSGIAAEPIPYRVVNDNLLTVLLIFSFIIMTRLYAKLRPFVRQQLHDFLFPPHGQAKVVTNPSSYEKYCSAFIIVLLSIIGGIIFFGYAQYSQDIFLGQLSPYFLLTVYSGVLLCYFMLKSMMYSFVNWVFFDKTKILHWRLSNRFVLITETWLLFPTLLVIVYFNLSVHLATLMFVSVLVFVKMLLIYKEIQIFFPKFSVFLHLFVYLCALEVMPLVAIWALMTQITENMIVKF